jgi:mono/diheme cytochrome c family protein
MRKKNYIKRISFYIAILVVLVFATVYIWSTLILDKTYDIPLSEVHIPHDSASLIEGKRLIRIEHCSDCHGARLSGGVIGKFIAPNLTEIIPTYSNGELERLLKYGVKKDGQSVYEMPIFMYHQLQDESFAEIIAYLRTIHPLPSTPGIPAKNTYGFLRRLKLIAGSITPGMIKPDVPRPYLHYDTSQVAFGKYLAMTSCTSCHGENLKGIKGFSTDLAIVSAYNKENFFRLLRTGVALGDRKLGLMTKIATNNLKYLNDNEINSIYAYLKTKPTQ